MFRKCIFTVLCVCGILAAQPVSLQLGGGVANEGVAPGKPDTRIDYSPRSDENGYGYRGYTVPVGFTFLPWAVPNQESYANGLRLNFGWGGYKETKGLDLGLFSAGEEHCILGINVFGHYSENNAHGCEIGLVNVTGDTMTGLQVGLVDYADALYGGQIGLINISENNSYGCEIGLANVTGGTMFGHQLGLVNYADTLYGVQIGLINIARTQWCVPIINICW